MPETTVVWAHCNSCTRQTRHELLFVTSVRDDREVTAPQWDDAGHIYLDTYELIQCLGCQTVTFRQTFVVEGYEDQTRTLTFFPPRVSRRLPKWKDDLAEPLQDIINQVYAALHLDHSALALMGARAVVDMIIIDKVGDRGSFQSKLQALQTEGYIGSRARNVLDAALDTGNAASHRGHNPPSGTVNEVMDIVENLLEAIYRHDGIAERLRASTPQRSRGGLRAVDPSKDESDTAS